MRLLPLLAILMLSGCTVVKDPDTGVAILTTPADSQYQRLITARISYESWGQSHSAVIRSAANGIGNAAAGIITAGKAPTILETF